MIGRNGIPYNIVPVEKKSMIVLWQQSGLYSGQKWLAYKLLTSSDHVVEGNGKEIEKWSSLMVRVREGASVAFNSGGTTPIVDGNSLTGQSSTATGTVNGDPMVTSGSWAGGNAAGWILITNVTGTFQVGETLLVGGQDLATSQGFRARDNYIRVYYGDRDAHGTASSNPLDNNRLANPRGQVDWPPDEVDEWAAENDHFTLVQWNSNLDSSVVRLGTSSEPNAIIRTNSYTTPSSGSFTRPEIGLHTFGKFSNKSYFDDFAIKTEGGGKETGFLPPIQQ